MKPKYRFCWVCSKQLWGNRFTTAMANGHEVHVHGTCSRDESLLESLTACPSSLHEEA
jgi:hypothetical protein